MITIFPLIAIIILLIITTIAVVMTILIFRRQREGKQVQVDYRAFFIMGLIFTPIAAAYMIICFILGLPFFSGLPLLILGILYLIISLPNRDKWK
jgi:ABC-type xylose transport system permease subunit